MAEKEKSWKKQAEEFSNRSEKLSKEVEAYLSKFKSKSEKKSSRKGDKNPTDFERLVLYNLGELRKGTETVMGWLSRFEWMSKKQWWIGMLVTILITILVGAFTL